MALMLEVVVLWLRMCDNLCPSANQNIQGRQLALGDEDNELSMKIIFDSA